MTLTNTGKCNSMRLPEFTETAHSLINTKHVHKSSQDLAKMTTNNIHKTERKREEKW